MPLLAYNKTTSPVALAAGSPAVTLPASLVPGARGKAFDVTSELWPNLTVDPAHGRTGGLAASAFTALQVQVAAGSVEYAWTHQPEFSLGTLVVTGPAPGAHATTHKTAGGTDVLAVDSTTAANGATTATNQNATATNQGATATNQNTATAQVVDLGAPDLADIDVIHAAILATDAGSPYNADAQPDVPRNLTVDFAATWDGGKITVTGTDQFDVVVSEDFLVPGGLPAQVVGVKVFKTIVALGIAKETVGSNAVAATVGTGNKLGITPATAVKGMLTVDGVADAGTWDGTYSAVTPATAPDGLNEYLAVVKTNHLHVQNSHNHTQDAHNHTQDSHNHTQSGHAHNVT